MSQPRDPWPKGTLQQLLARAEGGERCACGVHLHPLQGTVCAACRRPPASTQEREATDHP
jgi:hypothetical protein